MRPALAAFRRLMRARELAFKGDLDMLQQSRLAVREEFLRHKVHAAPASVNARCAMMRMCNLYRPLPAPPRVRDTHKQW